MRGWCSRTRTWAPSRRARLPPKKALPTATGRPRVRAGGDRFREALDVAAHLCAAILYSEHPAESLCGAPLIVGTTDDPSGKAWLILTQKQPLDDVQLRVFDLPIKARQTGELKLTPSPRVPGWSWFPPKYDGEKLALLSDAGVLGLFGIKQAGTHDAALFPVFPGSQALNLDTFHAGHRLPPW